MSTFIDGLKVACIERYVKKIQDSLETFDKIREFYYKQNDPTIELITEVCYFDKDTNEREYDYRPFDPSTDELDIVRIGLKVEDFCEIIKPICGKDWKFIIKNIDKAVNTKAIGELKGIIVSREDKDN